MRISIFPTLRADVVQQSDLDWSAIVAMCQSPQTYPTKQACPLIKLASFGDKRTEKQSLRHAANMLEVSGVELDYDAEQMQPVAAAAMLQLYGITAVIYTSPSHTAAAPRWRVMAPLSRPYQSEARREFVARINAALGGVCADESYVMAQAFYIGRVAEADYECHVIAGQPVDLVANLPVVYPVERTSAPVVPVAAQEYRADPARERVALGRIERMLRDAAPGERHAARLRAAKLAGGYVGGGVLTEDVAWAQLLRVSDAISDNGETTGTERVTLEDGIMTGRDAPITDTHSRPDLSAIGFGQGVMVALQTPTTAGTTNWLQAIHNVEDEQSLQQLIQLGIAYDDTLDAVLRTRIEMACKQRFADFGLTMRADILRKLLKPRAMKQLPDLNSDEKPQETMANVSTVCDNNGVLVRYNVIKKDDEILIEGASWSVDNARNASLTWVRSLCHKSCVPTRYLKNMITLIADKNQFNPVVEWVQSVRWDGVSRVEQFYDTVVENKAECDPVFKRLVMRKWAISAIAAAFSPNGIQARGVIVFQGQQYAGKTRWIDSLAPKDLEFVKIGQALNVHDKDSVKKIISCWIGELGELDATFKKSDIAALKAFITNDSDELRRPYAEGESRYARRTVFAASVNDKRFLQDDTGNSRFWVISIDAIRHDHGLNMQQVWAEFYRMWQAGETHYMTADQMEMVNTNNETFMASDPIGEMIESHLDWEHFSPADCEWMQPSDVLRWVGHKNPTKSESTLAGKAILRLNGGCHRKSNGRRLSGVPKTRRIITGVFG